MSIEKRAEATAKDVQGKIQEAWGDLTDDPQQELEGKAKQVEASAEHKKEDLKDAAKRTIDNV
ncbi:CsbD family protein [Gloeobacter kilaueensis]|uniref:CsbD family protein n=1 Tax=Gloeobacter kilaueensis (strain ATCC BAA-2537 / CCAP 1431/1 / ULC 316 / JS1) TaxID=1183438 RepID=U5QQT8_GLOK1|nr:CsbD family protein [Gloeobacter kilaueensis]AGY59994.1 CsbD family protein [Gloeobacter kilaueensis JS1]